MVDTDGDGLDDEEETYYNTKQLCADTDGDNLSDGEEIDLWFDPTDPNPDGDSYDDEEEKDNNTNPFVYDLNFEEAGEEWSKGVLLGDLETADNVPALLGHITGSFIPYIDGRDFIANVKNGDYKAAALNLFGLALDIFTGPIGAAYDVTKGFAKLSRFAAKYSDDAPKVVQAVTKASEYFPDAEKVIPDLTKVLPASALDDLADSVKNGSKLTQKEYDKLLDIYKAAGKSTDEIVEVTKFKSFRQLKKYLGDPGKGKEWHHIVEQCQAKAKRSGFDISEINKVSNVKATPKDVHKEISRYYSSKQDFTGNLTFRDWLNGKSYDEQYKYGIETWEREMKKAGYSIK
ncbi:MAG: hypothetical protein K6B68_15045 [Eubacterium sp.]|nr:hypothetical protein [Eubacterium sp.]